MADEDGQACRVDGHTLILPYKHKYSDMKITFGKKGVSFPVHKIVVCSQSAVISKALDSPFLEGSTANFDLPGYDGKVIGAMLTYMYGRDYDISDDDIISSDNTDRPLLDLSNLTISAPADQAGKSVKEILFHASVSCLAAYLEIPTLSSLANQKLEKMIKTNWSRIKSCFPGVVKKIYDMDSHDSLHKILIEACARDIQFLYNREDFKHLDICPPFHAEVFARSLEMRTLQFGHYYY